MQSHCSIYNGVIISWSTNIETVVAADLTDSEIHTVYCTIKKMTCFSHFLTSSSVKKATYKPFTLYAENNASINIILQNKILSRSCHLDIPVTFSHEEVQQQYIEIQYISSKLNASDISNKAANGPTHARH